MSGVPGVVSRVATVLAASDAYDSRYVQLNPSGGALQTIAGSLQLTKSTSGNILNLTNPSATGFGQMGITNDDGSASFLAFVGGSAAAGVKVGVQGIGNTAFESLGGSFVLNTRLANATALRRGFNCFRGATGAATVFEWFSASGQSSAGEGIFSVENASVIPTGNRTTGGYLYAFGGGLFWRGSAGTVTPIALP